MPIICVDKIDGNRYYTSRKLLSARDRTISAPAVTRVMLLLCSSSTHYPTRDLGKRLGLLKQGEAGSHGESNHNLQVWRFIIICLLLLLLLL